MTIGAIPEVALRVGAFVLVFGLMAWLELQRPKRTLRHERLARWPTNLTIVVIDSVLVRLMAALAVPLVAIAAADYAERHHVGLVHWLDLPALIAVPACILILDFAIWLQHWASHKVPLFWRLHRMHHADQDIDVTTAIRFHPIEIALSMLWKIVWVLVLGAPAVAVLLFEIILNGCAMFNHANAALPVGLDRLLRRFIVTPDMHRVHHSVLRDEHDSNYGFNFPFWDWIFRTYTAQPSAGHTGMTIGLSPYQSDGPTRLGWCLILPLQKSGSQVTAESPAGPSRLSD